MNDKKNKILFAAGIYPPEIGGPATFAYKLRNELVTKGLDIKVLTYSNNKDEDGVYCVRRDQNILFRYIKYFVKAYKLSKDTDIIYIFDLISVGIPCSLLKIFRPKIKIIARVGGDQQWEKAVQNKWYFNTLEQYYIDKNFNSKEKLMNFFTDFVLKKIDIVIFNANLLRNIYIKYKKLNSNKTKLIRNIRIDNKIIVKEYQKEGCIKILYIGRLVSFKNIFSLIKAIQEVKGNFLLDIYGEGPEKDEIVKYIKQKGLEKKVKINSKLEHSKVLDKMQECDIFVVPSLTEVNANTISEVMLFNVCIISTKESETYLENIKDEKLFYIDPLNIEDIKKKLDLAIKKAENLRNKDSVDLINVDDKLSWDLEKIVNSHLDIFKNL